MERVLKESRSHETTAKSNTVQSAATVAESPFSASINNSPAIAVQRQKLNSLFGDAAQLQPDVPLPSRGLGAEPIQRAEDEEEKETVQGKQLYQEHGVPLQRVEEEEEKAAVQGKFQVEPAQRAEDEEEKETVQGRFAVAQLLDEEEETAQPKRSPVAQRQGDSARNETGLPDHLKSGIENLSGLSLDSVRVHYNSSQPAQLNALAYTQGTEIHVAPGQERHLPHEAWHVVQQAQGRVEPTMQMKQGVPVNDDRELEREADLMGERAVQARQAPDGDPPQQPSSGGVEVAQLAFATVNPQNGPVGLQQVGGGVAFLVMQNPGQVVGDDVKDTVGFTGVLNAADWADLGKSPKDYWRAHGYAKSFGGAGDITNVGWWRSDAEENWTEYEQQVRGAGLAQIPEWLPGTGETGTYQVDRTMHPVVALKDRYAAELKKAVAWGLDDSRPAWARALATCDDIFPIKDREKRIAELKIMKTGVVQNAAQKVQAWVNVLFAASQAQPEGLGSNLIKSMKMTYTITNAGANPGPNRANLTKTINSAPPSPMSFGLKAEPERIWVQLVNHNVGLFAQGNPPTNQMVERLAYSEPHKPAQEFRAYADGWGV